VHAHALGDQPADGDGVRPSARSIPQIITRKMPGGNALSCRRHAEISLEAALRRGGCPSVASQALTRPEFASYTARMPFDRRRNLRARTIPHRLGKPGKRPANEALG
jgi:hypothetical protein